MGEWPQARTENGSIRAGVDQEIVF